MGHPNNLMPYIMQVATGEQSVVNIFGGDYPTNDGTAIRDYIHVVDLARGHLAAVESLSNFHGCTAINLGTGHPYSVLEVIKAASHAVGYNIPYKIIGRRTGDVAACWAEVGLAKKLLNWQTKFDLNRMCADHWRWQRLNPHGYKINKKITSL